MKYLHVSYSPTQTIVSAGGSCDQTTMLRMCAASCESVRKMWGLTPAGMLVILSLMMEDLADGSN